MLDGTADPDGQVELRPDRHPRLADLQHFRNPAAVDGLARRRDRAAEQVRELLEHREVLRVPEAVATAHDDVGFLRSKAALFRELLKLLERRVDVRGPELDRLPDDFARPLRIVRWRDEDVPPYRSHLRTVLLAQDVGEALPAEARADHVEVALHVDVELDAVGRQAGLEDRVKAASEVPSVLRRAVEDDLRFVTANQLGHHLGVRSRTVNLEDWIVDDDHAVQAVADRVLREVVDSVSQEDAGQGRRPQVREAPAFADQLHAHVSQSLLAVLEEHPHPAEMGLVLEDVAVRHRAITRSAIKASRSCRTVSSGSPEKIRPARGGNFTVSTLATIVGELNSPTFFGSMPTSAHDQWVIRPPRSTRIFPVSVGSRGRLQPKFTVHRQGIVVCHHSVPSSAVRRARTFPSSIRISDTYVIWGRSKWPAIPGPTWPVDASVVSSPQRRRSYPPIFWIVSLSAYAVGTVSEPPRIRSVRSTDRSAPIATARSRLSSNDVGPIERTTTSAACWSFRRSAISRAFASGGLISLGTPTRLSVCVTGSTWSSCARGTCLMHTITRIGRAAGTSAVTSIGLPAGDRGAS